MNRNIITTILLKKTENIKIHDKKCYISNGIVVVKTQLRDNNRGVVSTRGEAQGY